MEERAHPDRLAHEAAGAGARAGPAARRRRDRARATAGPSPRGAPATSRRGAGRCTRSRATSPPWRPDCPMRSPRRWRIPTRQVRRVRGRRRLLDADGRDRDLREVRSCPVKVVIVKNNTLGQIKWEQIVFLGNPEYGCELQPMDFARCSRGRAAPPDSRSTTPRDCGRDARGSAGDAGSGGRAGRGRSVRAAASGRR